MRIAIRGGHNFQAVGAEGILKEVVEDRKIKDATIKYLRELGQEVLDVTPGECGTNEDLAYGVNKANQWGADIFASIHLNKAYNSYDGAIGSEVCVAYPHDEAQRVVNNLGALGFKNRGLVLKPGYYEIRNTSMKAMIIETLFCEATKDVELYNNIGPDALGKAIAEGIVGQHINIETITKGTGYVVTNYLPNGYEGYNGVDINYVLSYFQGVKCYIRANEKGIWIETQTLQMEKCLELKKTLGSWFYSIV